MFHLLKVKISGFKMLEDDFEIDFVAKARVYNSDEESEIIEIDNNLYTFNMFAFTGSNSSGKTTTLLLLNRIIILMGTGRWQYNSNEFRKDIIDMHIEFYLDGQIYIYDSKILKNDDIAINISSQFCRIKDEVIKFSTYNPIVGKRYESMLQYEEDKTATGIEDTSKLIYVCGNVLKGYYLAPFYNNGTIVNEGFFKSLNIFDEELTSSIIQLLDDSIEKIEYTKKEMVIFKRFGEAEKEINKLALLNQLSNGTIKGIELYIRVVDLIKKGGILIIDEIENCFHKNLVNNILFLLKDKAINRKNAQILFSTHYVEILDVFERRDNIFVLHKNGSIINISNLYEKYPIRTEIIKSKQFNNNAFGTLLNYDKLMKVKRLIKNEISNYN